MTWRPPPPEWVGHLLHAAMWVGMLVILWKILGESGWHVNAL